MLSWFARRDTQVVNRGDAATQPELKYVKNEYLTVIDGKAAWDHGVCVDGQGMGSSNDALTTDGQLKRMSQMVLPMSVTCRGRVGMARRTQSRSTPGSMRVWSGWWWPPCCMATMLHGHHVAWPPCCMATMLHVYHAGTLLGHHALTFCGSCDT